MSYTRKTIRRAIADKVNDCLVLTATSDSDSGVIIDEENLTDSDNGYRNAQLMATGGTAGNLGEVRAVLSSQQSTTSVTLLTSFPEDISEGDEFEMVKLKGIGFRFQQYHRLINEAIGVLREGEYLVRSVQDATDPFDADDPDVTIPTTLVYIDRVQYLDATSDPEEWVDIPKARIRDAFGDGWTPVGATGVIRINGSCVRDVSDENTIRFYGYTHLADLDDDDDTFAGPTEYVVYRSAHILAFARGGPDWTPKAMFFNQAAENARPKSSIPWGSNLTKVR